MSARERLEWTRYFNRNGLGDREVQMTIANGFALVANMFITSDAEPISPYDIAPWLEDKDKAEERSRARSIKEKMAAVAALGR